MFKKEEGITLAMLTLSVAILLMIAFATVLIVFDSGVLPNNIENTNQSISNDVTNSEQLENQEFNRTDDINNQ